MSRARASALALVNWKGVFFERYLLDRHVTALEGANGAGKTSVMIAAYVVLLPDMSRLRFTNLGETSATGGDRGIFGRLGESGRPSYTALELDLGGERVILGVHLERKAEPSVEPTAFVVTGLDRRHGLSELFLLRDGESESVPLLAELRGQGTRLGANVEVFETIRDYFVWLFERGITPLRLSNEDDRGKFNEMLRTSMTGGISRALTSELRLFLLKEEAGLTSTLSRMRENLDACRRTRIEVQESRSLEREISGVYDAGLAMFGAALSAAREQAREQARRRDQARAEYEAARFALLEIENAELDLAGRDESAASRVSLARAAREALRSQREAAVRAQKVAERVRELEGELVPEETRSLQAKRELELATELREAERAALETARAAYDRAARGLANLQTGLSELHRRAHAYRRGHASLALSRELLGDPALEDDGLIAAIERAKNELARADVERVRRERELRTATQRRLDFARAEAALKELVGDSPALPLYETARAELRRLDELDKQVAELSLVHASLSRARDDHERQKALGAKALELGIEALPGEFVAALERALLAREAEVFDADERAAAMVSARRNAEEECARLRERIRRLESEAEHYRACVGRAEKLSPEAPPRTREELLAVRERLLEQRERLRAGVAEARSRREALLTEVARFGREDGAAEPELLELCEALGGELFAARFEDIEVDRAAFVEAELGPLANAIVVEDVDAAVAELERVGTTLAHVWLVRAGETVRHDIGRKTGGAVSVPTELGRRVSRMPERPTLGRSARAARAKSLALDAERTAAELERLSAELRRSENLLDDADALVGDAAVLEGADPALALAEQKRALFESEARVVEHAESGAGELTRNTERKRELQRLRSLRGDAHLLDREDASAAVLSLSASVEAAEKARAELGRAGDARKRLVEWCDALRDPPPGDEEFERFERERALLDAERDRWFRAVEALETALESRQARSYTGAEAALDESARLVPALEAEQEKLAAAVAEAGRVLALSEADWERKALSFQAAEARRAAVSAQLERERRELSSAIERDGVSLDEAKLALEIEQAASAVSAVEREVQSLAEELGSLRERRRKAQADAVDRERLLEKEAISVGSLERRYVELLEKAQGWQLSPARLEAELAATHSGQESAALLPEARSRREVLLDRLSRARGGQALAEELSSLPSSVNDIEGTYLEAWRRVRDWLARRLPSQVAEIEDPLDALERLRDQLASLEERLTRQELDLRGASEDVARGIDVKLRRATAQVRRLNQHLEGVSFGSIRGIRVQMNRLERMDRILKALREGEAQELLFQSALPVEEALDEIFRRYGGGGKTGGQRLLDYREYLELAVEVERKASAGFEAVSPTRLSTGEAIGVGAALMMVVLTEWERDANLFRNRKSEGTLRFLFLDEANRLSQDNLGVLFDLCESLDLQLLIAAPEVARASGNTTYRLVRRVNDDGAEEVIVSGRRALLDDSPALQAHADPEGETEEETAEFGDAFTVGESDQATGSPEFEG